MTKLFRVDFSFKKELIITKIIYHLIEKSIITIYLVGGDGKEKNHRWNKKTRGEPFSYGKLIII